MIKPEDYIIIDRIKQIREKHDLSQARFADLIGVSAGNIGQWERYMSLPGAIALRQIANKLECSVDWILTGIEQKSSNLSTEHIELLKLYDQLDDEGKAIIKAACYQERRRAKSGGSP